MAGVRIEVEADGGPVLEALGRLARAGGDVDGVLRYVGEALLIRHRERFERQEAPDGTPWAPLSERYRRRKRTNPDRILVLDGYLKDLLRYQVHDGTLELGTDRIYGATHQFGDDSRGIPARPFLGLSEEDRQEVLEIVLEALEEAVAG